MDAAAVTLHFKSLSVILVILTNDDRLMALPPNPRGQTLSICRKKDQQLCMLQRHAGKLERGCHDKKEKHHSL